MRSRRKFLRELVVAPFAASLLAHGRARFGNPFFAMDTAVLTPPEMLLQRSDVETLASLHYRGTSVGVTDLASWQHLTEAVLPWLEAQKMELYAVYSGARVNRDKFEVDPGIEQFGAALTRHRSTIWLPISTTDFKPSDPEGDVMAVEAVKKVAQSAAKFGSVVSLYPHFGNLVQSMADAIRIANKTGLKNVGVTFNLCHWLRVDGPGSLDSVLRLAAPRLSFVTLNGADRDGKDWGQLIQPLDRGSFDVKDLLRKLRSLHYRGPIGLQGYGVVKSSQVTPLQNLTRSMAAWRNLVASV